MMPRVWLFHATDLAQSSTEWKRSPWALLHLSLNCSHDDTILYHKYIRKLVCARASLALAPFTPVKTCLGEPITNCQGRQIGIYTSYLNVSPVSTISGFVTLLITSVCDRNTKKNNTKVSTLLLQKNMFIKDNIYIYPYIGPIPLYCISHLLSSNSHLMLKMNKIL